MVTWAKTEAGGDRPAGGRGREILKRPAHSETRETPLRPNAPRGKIALEPYGCLGEQRLRGVAPLDSRQTWSLGCAEHLEGHLVGAGVEVLLYPGADSVV